MAKEKKKYWLVLVAVLFVLYVFIAARPIPRETILISRWLTSLESGYPLTLAEGGAFGEGAEGAQADMLPFELGERFGYVDDGGRFIINRVRRGNLSLSEDRWAEYGAAPRSLDIRNPRDEGILTINNGGGYPLFLDGRVFLLGSDQNSVTALDGGGDVRWTYDFSAPLTCADAAAGFFLAGSLDGRVELLDGGGHLVFPPFEPGGSRLSVILGCALSADGSRIAVISGIDDQRFLLLERGGRPAGGGAFSGGGAFPGESYRVIYHEFLTDGFRRPVHVAFIDNDNRVAFEREGGLGIYDISSRTGMTLPLDGEIRGFDGSGTGGLFFVLTAPSEGEKRLVAVRLPGQVIMEAPFKSGTAFLARRGSRLYVGGGMTLASFELGKR